MSAARWRSSRVCVGLHSPPVRRSFDKEMGATRVVVVIFSPCRRVREALRICSLRGSGGDRFGRFCENRPEQAKKIADLCASDYEGRQQAQCKIVGAIDEQPLTQGFGDEGIAIDGKLHAEDEAFAANFADEIEFAGKLAEALAEFGAARANVGKEFVLFEGV